MEEADVAGFKEACRQYFSKANVFVLRSYGRFLGLRAPTQQKKESLIEDVIRVLCGEFAPKRRGRKGAPVKNDYIGEGFREEVERLQMQYLHGDLRIKPVEEAPAEQPEPQKQPVALQIVIQFSDLNEKQKQLLQEVLKAHSDDDRPAEA